MYLIQNVSRALVARIAITLINICVCVIFVFAMFKYMQLDYLFMPFWAHLGPVLAIATSLLLAVAMSHALIKSQGQKLN